MHSPLSPLHPRSSVHPNGLLSREWIEKYLRQLPASFLLVQDLDASADGDASLVDSIVQLKTQLGIRGIRLVVVLVSDSSDAGPYNDRIAHIRRATGLPQRTGLLFAPRGSDVEKETLVETLCQLLYNNAIEYYSNVRKNIRRKRSKSPAEDAGSMQVITSLMWETRFSFKLASITEFTQDIEAALKAYWTAYDCIMDFAREVPPSDTQLWTQGRALLDAVAYKIVKMSLYQQEPNTAFRKFELHLKTVRRIVQEKEWSIKSRAFKSWVAAQYDGLAQLVSYSQDLFLPKGHALVPGVADGSPSSQLPRCGLLWLEAYRQLASLQNSQATAEDNDPYGDIGSDEAVHKHKVDVLSRASEDFASTVEPSMSRSLAYCWYLLGEAHESNGDVDNAAEAYREAVTLYRKDGWNSIVEECVKKLSVYDKKVDEVTRVMMQLEMLKIGAQAPATSHKGDVAAKTAISDPQVSLFATQFAFGAAKGNTGVEMSWQLQLRPLIAADMTVTRVELRFSGAALDPTAILHHDPSASKSGFIDIGRMSPGESEHSITGKANLGFDKGDPARTIQMEQVARNVGTVELEQIVLHIEGAAGFAHTQAIAPHKARTTDPVVYWAGTDVVHSRALRLDNPHSIQIDPRPSLVDIKHNASSAVAPGESVKLDLTVTNHEGDEIVLDLDGNGSLGDVESFPIEWSGAHRGQEINAGKDHMFTATFRVPATAGPTAAIEFNVSYHLKSDPDTVIKDAISLSLSVIKPFRVSFDVVPRVQPDDWPSLFVVDDSTDAQKPVFNRPLVAKRWNLSASLLVLGEAAVQIHNTELNVEAPAEVAVKMVEGPVGLPSEPSPLQHNDGMRVDYLFDCTLDSNPRDSRRNSVSAEAHLKVLWSRPGTSTEPVINEFIVPVVRMTLPLYEPRVIVDVDRSTKSRYIMLRYWLENATNHVLTFNVTVGSSPSFVFSGPRRTNLRLLPFSRRVLEFQLLPMSTGALKVPPVKIVDTYYKRQLAIIPAGSDIKADRASLVIVV